MMIGKIKLDYRKIKRVTYPKSSKLRFIYGQKSYETSLRFIDDFKLKKAFYYSKYKEENKLLKTYHNNLFSFILNKD